MLGPDTRASTRNKIGAKAIVNPGAEKKHGILGRGPSDRLKNPYIMLPLTNTRHLRTALRASDDHGPWS